MPEVFPPTPAPAFYKFAGGGPLLQVLNRGCVGKSSSHVLPHSSPAPAPKIPLTAYAGGGGSAAPRHGTAPPAQSHRLTPTVAHNLLQPGVGVLPSIIDVPVELHSVWSWLACSDCTLCISMPIRQYWPVLAVTKKATRGWLRDYACPALT